MSYRAIVSDWNGTLHLYPTDELQNKKIAYAVLDDAKHALMRGHLSRVADLFRLVRTKKELTKRLQDYKQGRRHLWEVYEPFNEGVLRGRSADFVRDVIDEYARETAHLVDQEMIGPIREAHNRGKATGILSVSFDYSIRKILGQSGAGDVFDTIVSNVLEIDGNGKVVGLTLNIYDRKPAVLRTEFFEKRGFRENDVLYAGDTEDDEPVALLLPRGNFIVPFLAHEGFKQKMASEYGAFVPEDEADLKRYLETK